MLQSGIQIIQQNLYYNYICKVLVTCTPIIFCRFFLYVLVIGQTLSIIITGMGVFATLFGKHTGKEVSTTMSAGAYFILSATAGPCVAYKAGFVDKLKQHWWKFLIIGLSDFYSTYLRTLALSLIHFHVKQFFGHNWIVYIFCHHSVPVHDKNKIQTDSLHFCYHQYCRHSRSGLARFGEYCKFRYIATYVLSLSIASVQKTTLVILYI